MTATNQITITSVAQGHYAVALGHRYVARILNDGGRGRWTLYRDLAPNRFESTGLDVTDKLHRDAELEAAIRAALGLGA